MAPPKNPEQHGMAFSAFAHIPDLQSLEFAVVLREEGNGEDIVSRMLPMSRIVPGEVKEREKKKPAAPISTKEPCTRPECMANRNRIQEMQDANEAVREQLEEVEIGIRQMMAKLEGLEKSNRSADQQNDELEGTNNELEQQIGMLEIEAEEGNRQKRDLHKKIAQLEKEIEMFMKQTEERNKQREQALKSNQNEVNFGGKGFKTSAEPFDKLFVSSLDMWDRQWGGSPTKQQDYLSTVNRPKTTPGRVFKMPTPKYLEKSIGASGLGTARPKSSVGTTRVRKSKALPRPQSRG